MKSTTHKRARELFDRISRVTTAEEWREDLNPAQRNALGYLTRANHFSRSPSNVADYLCVTRGTASQSLKALARKGFAELAKSAADKRSISYEATKKGRAALRAPSNFEAALSALETADSESFTELLELTWNKMQGQQGLKTFGLCNTCRYHQRNKEGLVCGLLKVPLTTKAANEICCEHEPH